MITLTFKLQDFEGPLDLLLYLIGKNKMDLHDIPIFELIRQYTEIIENVDEGQTEAASEFVAMAARLVQMKSYLLLPHSEEGERMKQELTGELIEYDQCRRIAVQLGQKAKGVYIAVRQPAKLAVDPTYRLHHDPGILAQALAGAKGKRKTPSLPGTERFEPLVAAPFVSVSSRVVHILRGMVKGKFTSLRQLFHKGEDRSRTVATFLAVLELVRSGRLTLNNETEEMTLSREKTKRLENTQ